MRGGRCRREVRRPAAIQLRSQQLQHLAVCLPALNVAVTVRVPRPDQRRPAEARVEGVEPVSQARHGDRA
eukprot:8439151-Alexandrium_andersonii.AAC.1